MIIALLVFAALAEAAVGIIMTLIGVAITWMNRRSFGDNALYSTLTPGIVLFTVASGAVGWGRSIMGSDASRAAPNVPLLLGVLALGVAGIGAYLWRVPASLRGAVGISLAFLLVGFFMLSAVVWNLAYIQHVIDTTCQTAPADCG